MTERPSLFQFTDPTLADGDCDTSEEEERELRGLWLSRLMFNPFVGWPEETRTFEEFCNQRCQGGTA